MLFLVDMGHFDSAQCSFITFLGQALYKILAMLLNKGENRSNV